MTDFGYRSALELTKLEVLMQLERAGAQATRRSKGANYNEVLHIPLLLAPVGVGKTSIIGEIEIEFSLPLIKLNCGENGDPTDVSGMPVPTLIKQTKGGRYMEWVLNYAMHRACEEPVVLAFDDIDKATPLVEGALIGIFGERRARDRWLHPGTIIIGAGNRTSDDRLAHQLSESLRTRATTIIMEPNFADFDAYAEKHPDKVHSVIRGFLHYSKSSLHKHEPDAIRFPTPRGWVEASSYLSRYPANHPIYGVKDAWSVFVELKCGEATASDFNAWYRIVRLVDVPRILADGTLDRSAGGATNDHMIDYAAIFALAQHLNSNPIKAKHTGLLKYLKEIAPEQRVALAMQLTHPVRSKIADVLPETANILLADLIP